MRALALVLLAACSSSEAPVEPALDAAAPDAREAAAPVPLGDIKVTVHYDGGVPDGSKLVFAANRRYPPTGPPQAIETLTTFTFPATGTLRQLEAAGYAVFVGLDIPPSFDQQGGRPGKEDITVLSSAPVEVPPNGTANVELALPSSADAGTD
jgi:hypothetical protein